MEPRLFFKHTSAADLPWLVKLESHSDNRQWILPYDPELHLLSINGADQYHFTVFANEVRLGFFILVVTSCKHQNIELRRIVIEKKGQKIGRKCLRWIKSNCFDEMGFHRLWLDVFTNNKRAVNLYLSEGFVREGVVRSCIFDGGAWRSLYQLSMLGDEFQNFKLNKSMPVEK